MGVDSGQAFPNAPLALVAAQVRFPPVADRELAMFQQKRIRDAVGTDWIIQNDTEEHVQIGVGPGGPTTASSSRTFGRIISRKGTRIITVHPDNFFIEVTDYTHFDEFQELLRRVTGAVGDVLEPDGISSMGLRYIDEIAVPDPEPKWSDWMKPSLLAPSLDSELTPSGWTGAAQYQVASDQILVLRYGPSPSPVVSPTGPLKRASVPTGPIFMLDFDSSWQPAEVPEFSAELISEVAVRLRAPLRRLFDSFLTPKLVAVFNGEEQP